MKDDDSEDEIRAFTRRIESLNDIASNLKDTIKNQNDRIRGIAPEMNGALGRTMKMIKRVARTDGRRFRGWIYYIGATLALFFLIFLLFIIFK